MLPPDIVRASGLVAIAL